MLKRSIIASVAVAATVAVGSLSGTASAASGPTQVFPGYGFDGNAHLIVGGGSTTLYRMAQSFATLWNDTASCATNNSNSNAQTGSPVVYPPADTATGAAYNQCLPSKQTYNGIDAGGNYDGDTVAIAAPTGSSDGIASLNGDAGITAGTYAYEGTNSNIPTNGTGGYSNGFGHVDFAISSRAAKTNGGNCSAPGANQGNELACDTFWGVASDGVEILTFGTHAGLKPGQGGSTDGQLTATDLYKIWSCSYTNWDQIPGLKLKSAPIVPWGMNSGSGTYADFDNYVTTNDKSAPSTFTPNGGSCDRELSTGAEPLENDIKPLVDDAAQNKVPKGEYKNLKGLSRSATSRNNPSNWIWFGSYGLLTAFPYTSQYTYSGTGDGGKAFKVNTLPAPVKGILPSSANIYSEKYPILRILNIVTTNADATCPLNTHKVCDLTADNPPKNGNGRRDINVKGANTGVGGAVREFVRFICREYNYQEPTDPYTGKNELTEINAAKAASGFEPVPLALRTKGSSCDVKANT